MPFCLCTTYGGLEPTVGGFSVGLVSIVFLKKGLGFGVWVWAVYSHQVLLRGLFLSLHCLPQQCRVSAGGLHVVSNGVHIAGRLTVKLCSFHCSFSYYGTVKYTGTFHCLPSKGSSENLGV